MDRHFDDPKHLRIKEHRLCIRVATDAAGADTITAFDNSEDRANDVNRLQERTAHLALIPEQEVFDQDARIIYGIGQRQRVTITTTRWMTLTKLRQAKSAGR